MSGGFLIGAKQETLGDQQSSNIVVRSGEVSSAVPASAPAMDYLDSVLPLEEEKAPSTASSPKREEPESSQPKSATKAFDRTQRKLEKAQRKLDRRKRREAKEARREARHPKQAEQSYDEHSELVQKSEVTSTSDGAKIRPQMLLTTKATSSIQKTEVPSTSYASLQGGRHAVRQRHIQHKRMAIMDPKALNEVSMHFSTLLNRANHAQIFMIKA